ncbi:hypothetical protein AVKW3434_12380 [Acidovorax sp. SUPP3434]|nr:hypothetical protein AVKW3434_12380 [Acidovorax sp. SUPP3434]
MAVAQHELHAPLQRQVFARPGAVRHGLDGPQAQLRLQLAQPARKEGEREHVRGREAQAGGRRVVRGARLDAGGLQVGQQGFHQGQKALPRRREGGRVRAAVEQLHAHPFLQRADVAAERGLGDGPGLGGAREIAALGQGQEVFQPFEIEGAVARSHGRRVPCR